MLETVSSKLDMLPVINERLHNLERGFQCLQTEINEMKNQLRINSDRIFGNEQRMGHLQYTVEKIDKQNRELYNENVDLKETLLEMQTRSMKDNLIFTNLPETSNNETPEQSETVIKNFLSNELEIEDNIELHVAHRLRPRTDNKPRSIVAKFEKRKDRNRVLKTATEKLKNTGFGVYEQYPKEIGDRRSELWPIFKRESRLEKNVKFNADKLIVDGRRIFPPSMPRKLPIDERIVNNEPPGRQPQPTDVNPVAMTQQLTDVARPV